MSRIIDETQKIEWLLKWFRGGSAPPYTIELRPTNNCNLKCLSCMARGRERYVPEEELSLSDYERILEQASELGARHIHISGGGEPLLRYDVCSSIMIGMKKKGIIGSMVTNGTQFKEGLIEQLVESGWDYLSFSIDGPDAKTHDHLRGVQGCFEKSTWAIKRFVHHKKAKGKDRPWIVICPVMSSGNYDRMIDFITLARDLGADEVLFQPINVREDHQELLLTPAMRQRLKRDLAGARQLAQEHGIKTNVEILDENIIDNSSRIDEVISDDAKKQDDDVLNVSCFYPWFFLGIRSNGIAEPCGVSSESTELDNVRDKPLRDIWFGSYFTGFRENILSGNIPGQCKRCCGASVLSIRQIREKLGKASAD